MDSLPDKQSAFVGGSGASVNVQFADGARLFYAFLVLLAVCIVFSTYAVVKASEVDDLKTEVRLLAYWSERAEIAAEKQGVKLPPLPKH